MGRVWVGYGGLVSDFSDFEPIGQATADTRRRIPLGQTDATPGARYGLFQNSDGAILLRPATRQKENDPMSQNLTELDQDLAAAIAAGDEDKVSALADQFEVRGLANLAAVLREKGAAGVRETLEFSGV